MKTNCLSPNGSAATVTDRSPDPPLPNVGERLLVLKGNVPIVVICERDEGEKVYHVYTPVRRRRYSADQIGRWWPSVGRWTGPKVIQRMVDKARRGIYDDEAEAAGYQHPLIYVLALANGLFLDDEAPPEVMGRE